MTEKERERLAKKLECTPLYEGHGEESDLPEIAAAQLRADGERIKALEAALKPFANSVYRDNGSLLLQDVPAVGDGAWLAAYQAIYTPWVK